MRRIGGIWLALAIVAIALVPVPLRADEAHELEREFGVLGRDTAEGRQFNDQLDRVVARMTAATGFRLKSAKILGGRSEGHDKVVNAFALPDGRIYVTLGLLRAIADAPHADAELAFVIGHEITHVVERHGKRRARQSTTAAIIAGLIGVASGDRAVADAARLGAVAYVTRYSRRDEYTADRGGLLAMQRAGYPLEAAVSMLERLKEKGGDRNRFINGLFGTHPLTETRMKRIRQLIDEIQAGRTPATSPPNR